MIALINLGALDEYLPLKGYRRNRPHHPVTNSHRGPTAIAMKGLKGERLMYRIPN